MAKRFFVRIGSEEKNIIFGGRGCRALRDASKDTSFRLEGHIYKRHPPTNRRLGDGDPRGEKERRIPTAGLKPDVV